MADYANLAMSLRDNEAFQAALDAVRSNAIDTLISINADDKNGLLKAQATVAVVDTIREHLDAFVRAGQPRSPAGIA